MLYPPPPPASATEIEHVGYSLTCVRIDMREPGLAATARSKIRGDETRYTKLLLSLKKEQEMTEARYVAEHPAFKRLLGQIVRAVKPFPDAAEAIAELVRAEELEANHG